MVLIQGNSKVYELHEDNNACKDALPVADQLEEWRNPKLQLVDVDRPHTVAGGFQNRTWNSNHVSRSGDPDGSNGSIVF